MKLNAPGWSEKTRSGLEGLITAGSGRGLPVVFDFDNTIVCGDIGEATMALLATEGILRTEPIPETLAPPFMSRRGKMISLRDCPDVTVYYEELLDATWRAGNDPAPFSNGYVWAVQIMQGLTALDVVRATERVHAMSEPFREKSIEVTTGKSAYPVPFFYPEMVELIAALLDNGFDVWIISASNVWSVRWMVLRPLNSLLTAHGCNRGIRPDRVVGLSMLLADREGRQYKDPLLARSDSGYAGMEYTVLSELTITGMVQYPAPVYSGKVANIIDLIGRPPYLAAGDSPGDLPMLAFSENRLWIARLEKPGYQKEAAGAAAREGGRWMVQPALCRAVPGFIDDTVMLEGIFHGEVPATVAESIEAVHPLISKS